MHEHVPAHWARVREPKKRRARAAKPAASAHRCTQNKCGVDWCTSAEVLDVAAEIKRNGMKDAGYDHIK